MEKGKIDLSKDVAAGRRHIAGLLAEALNSLNEPREDFMDALRNITAYYEDKTGYYPVLVISKDDICHKGFNPGRLSPEEMRSFEDAFADDACLMNAYWDIVSQVSQALNLPELRTEIDSLYEAYRKEAGKEPSYAGVWLEDKGYNNLPWAVNVKLSLVVDEREDEQIYMYFQGYADLKKWLYSTLREDSNSEDVWCYENPGHRIVFYDKLLLDD